LTSLVLGLFAILIVISIVTPTYKAIPLLPLTLVFPFGNLPVHPYFGVLTVSTIFLFIIIGKVLLGSIIRDTPHNGLGVLAFVNAVCVLIVALGPVHSINPLRSTGIGLAMIINFYFIQTLSIDDSTSWQLVKILRVFVISLSMFAILEYILKSNFLYGKLYASANVSIIQEWSVYRVTTLLGHPLSNATVFGCFSLLFFIIWISTNSRSDFVAFLLPAVGLGLTAARGSIVSYAICLSIIILFFPGAKERSGRYTRILATMTITMLAIFILIRGIEQFRFTSTEGTESTKARLLLIKRVTQIIPSNPFGFGPGTAQEYFTTNSNTKLIVENSIFEILLGFGIIGGSIICISVALMLIKLLREKSLTVVPFFFFLTSTASYNFLEGNRNGYAVFGILYLLKDFRKQSLLR
jgi:hypothetical protein